MPRPDDRSVPEGDLIRTFRTEDEPITAYVRDEEVAGLRTTFVRLIPRGDSMPRQTITASYADVDLDAEGNIIGFNLVFATPLGTASNRDN